MIFFTKTFIDHPERQHSSHQSVGTAHCLWALSLRNSIHPVTLLVCLANPLPKDPTVSLSLMNAAMHPAWGKVGPDAMRSLPRALYTFWRCVDLSWRNFHPGISNKLQHWNFFLRHFSPQTIPHITTYPDTISLFRRLQNKINMFPTFLDNKQSLIMCLESSSH